MPLSSPRAFLLACVFLPLIATPALTEEKTAAPPVPASATFPMPMPGPPLVNYNGGTAIINFVTHVSDKTMADLVKAAQDSVTRGADSIRINISSMGGTTTSMQFAVNALKNLPVPVETVAMSYIASAAVALYCAGERRYMADGAALYLHQQTTMKRIMNKTADAVVRSYNLTSGWYDDIIHHCVDADADRTGLDYKVRDVVIDAEQATALGMVTGPMEDLRHTRTWGLAMNVITPENPQMSGYPVYQQRPYDANR